MSTIFAVSSGRPPAAIAVIRVSGPRAFAALETLAGKLPPARRATVRALRDPAGDLLDRALVLVFPGPATATGEDLVELHCHGGRAVVAAVERAVASLPDLRLAEPGEFTRRALTNGRIDMLEAEGLADLLEAETEGQRRAALIASEGRVSGHVRQWMDRITQLSARVEAAIDYSDEDDVDDVTAYELSCEAISIADDITRAINGPPIERLRDGVRVALAGPPNSGKSTLLNALVQRDAAIVSPIAGTTRDRIDVPVQRAGIAYLVTDTAGLRETDDAIEAIGVERATAALDEADIALWLGDDLPPRHRMIWLHARADAPSRPARNPRQIASVSARDAASIDRLWEMLHEHAQLLSPSIDQLPLRREQQEMLMRATDLLAHKDDDDILLIAERLRGAGAICASLLGLDATQQTLDAIFSRFCIGK